MEIAAADGEELLFEQYRRSINVAVLPPQLEVLYWFQGGTGYESLGNFGEARQFLEKALTFAEENELFQFAFQATSALRSLGSAERRQAVAKTEFVESEVEDIALRLRQDREQIGV